MFWKLADWVREKCLGPVSRLLERMWRRIKEAKLWEWIVGIAVSICVVIMPEAVLLALAGSAGSKFGEEYKYYRQLNVLAKIGLTVICVFLWFWAREIVYALAIFQLLFMVRSWADKYKDHRRSWHCGSAILLSLWDAFGLFGEQLLGVIRSKTRAWAEKGAPADPWITRRTIRKRSNPYPTSSGNGSYELEPFEGRKLTRFWLEEHRTPNLTYRRKNVGNSKLTDKESEEIPLSGTEVKELKRAAKGAHGILYRKGTEIIDPDTGYAVEGEKIGTWHNDLTIQHPDGHYLRWASVPPKDKSNPDNIKKGMGKYDIFPGFVPDEDGNTRSISSTLVLQPKHLKPTNPEVMPTGYGQGVCKVVKTGRAEVWLGPEHEKESGTVRYLHFKLEGIDGQYAIIHDPNKDHHLINRLQPRPVPRGGKLRMKEVRPGSPEAERLFKDENYLAQAKKDGASGWIKVSSAKGETRLSIGSWRESKNLESDYGVKEPIDYTDKLPHIRDKVQKIPAGTVDFEGRVEIWCGGKDGDRNLQQKLQWDDIKCAANPAKPYIYVVDITRWNGEDVSHLPYEEKLKLIKQLHEQDNTFKVPPTAMQEQAKRNLWEEGRKEAWVDGVVFKHRSDPNAPTYKLKYQFDPSNKRSAKVLSVNEGSNRLQGSAGSLECVDTKTGIEFNVSGEGMTDEVRKYLWEHRDELEGHTIGYYCHPDKMEQHGEVFQPVLADLNLD